MNPLNKINETKKAVQEKMLTFIALQLKKVSEKKEE